MYTVELCRKGEAEKRAALKKGLRNRAALNKRQRSWEKGGFKEKAEKLGKGQL